MSLNAIARTQRGCLKRACAHLVHRRGGGRGSQAEVRYKVEANKIAMRLWWNKQTEHLLVCAQLALPT